MTAPAGSARFCAHCSAPLGEDQRYCLECGERVGPASDALRELIARNGWSSSAGSRLGGSAEGAPIAAHDATRRSSPAPRRSALGSLSERISALSLPSRRVCALLVLAFVGFGVLLGNVAGSRVQDTLAASVRPRLKLVLPSSSKPASTSEEPAQSSEAPSSEAQSTPEASGESSSSESSATSAPAAKSPTKSASEASKSGGGEGGSKTPAPGASAKLPAIKHVFVVMLSDEPYAATFGPESKAPYLARTLEGKGELLVSYFAVAHQQLANGIALLSGQGPTAATAANCPTYEALSPASSGAQGQFLGEGCVYPPTTPTLVGQLEVKQLTWRAYVQGIDEAGSSAPACAHPTLGSADSTSTQPYATFRNPFVYFQGLTESPSCAADDVGLSSLDADLASAKRTPSLSYIVPDRCHDASPGPCPTGGAGGLPAADQLLEEVVPKILASKAYKESGLLVITTDEAPSSGEFADSSSCCGEPRFPNLPAASTAAGLPAEGGGQVGALLLSPFVKPHSTTQESYNHFSLLRTIEDLFGLKHLGYAGAAHVSSFAPSLFVQKSAK